MENMHAERCNECHWRHKKNAQNYFLKQRKNIRKKLIKFNSITIKTTYNFVRNLSERKKSFASILYGQMCQRNDPRKKNVEAHRKSSFHVCLFCACSLRQATMHRKNTIAYAKKNCSCWLFVRWCRLVCKDSQTFLTCLTEDWCCHNQPKLICHFLLLRKQWRRKAVCDIIFFYQIKNNNYSVQLNTYKRLIKKR